MALGKTRAESIDLATLLEGIHDGEVVLPDFQRDFDWLEKNVVALLATVLSGWPVGSLLLVEGPPTFFSIRTFSHAPDDFDEETLGQGYIVLDGQQRLTSLYHALYARGRSRYALHLNQLDEETVDNLEEAIRAHSQSTWLRRYATTKQQLSANIVPISALRSPADFFSWRDNVAELLPATQRENWLARVTRLYKRLLSGLDRYTIPCIVLSRSIPAEAIARIFERVNRTGLKLGTFDLMVAKSYAEDFNLREEWKEAQRLYPVLAAFLEDDGLPVLHSIALRLHRDVRQAAVLRLTGENIRDEWWRAVQGMDRAYRFLQSECGVRDPSWLPYGNLSIVLGSLAAEFDLDTARDVLLSWFWSVAAGAKYDVGSNTAAVRDYQLLARGGYATPSIDFVVEEVIESTPRRQSVFARAFRCAIAAAGAIELANGQAISFGDLTEGEKPGVYAHSIFLASYRAEQPADPPLATRTLSMCLSGLPSSQFEAQVFDVNGVVFSKPEIMESQFMPFWNSDLLPRLSATDVLSLRLDSLAEFLRQRGVVVNLLARSEIDEG